MTKEQKELERIEKEKSTWKSKWIREQEIWDEIAMMICGTEPKSKEQEFWERVMDLYKKKYKHRYEH